MSVFEYPGILVSVIMGLGITHMLAGVSKMIHHRETMKIYWVHIVWTLNLLLVIIAIWWGMFWWSFLRHRTKRTMDCVTLREPTLFSYHGCSCVLSVP